jgi:hypothetical protein
MSRNEIAMRLLSAEASIALRPSAQRHDVRCRLARSSRAR